MTQQDHIAATPPPSKLMIADHLISLAKEAECGGFSATADRLVRLAWNVFDELPTKGKLRSARA